MPPVPDHVKQAIRDYQPREGFTVVPKRRGERSLILDWGVRVSCMLDGKEYIGWICQGSGSCQRSNKIIQLFGNTSKATKHLSEVHKALSTKALAEHGRKRSRQEILDRILGVISSPDESRRMALLVETLRIIRNNLPFRMGEYEESELLADLVTKEEFRATINRHTVSHAIVDLYSSARFAVRDYLLKNRTKGVASFAMVADFWSCKTQQATKYLGMRVYLIDADWNYRSILLGTRHFEPLYEERCAGFRGVFKRWILELLRDFGLEQNDFYGATSDAGPDVKWMLGTGLSLQWEWCMPHLTNAATKTAFGIVPQRSQSKNIMMTDLISRMAQTIYAVRSNESMGSLFAELCTLLDPGSTTQLLSHKDHRFMGLTRVIRRILEKWEPLVQFFEERRAKAVRERRQPPQDLPISKDKQSLLQLLALLDPITVLNVRAQGETANQVEVLLTAYRLRMTILDESTDLPDRLATGSGRPVHRIAQLTAVVRLTRALLATGFEAKFFSRYTDRAKMRQCAYIPEAQMLLHPSYKNPDGALSKIVRLCSSQCVIDPNQPNLRLNSQAIQRNVDKVKASVRKRIISLMMVIAKAEAGANEPCVPLMELAPPPAAYSEELMDMFGEAPTPTVQVGVHEARVEEELDRWLADPIRLDTLPDNTAESILKFWQRQEDTNNYHFLPRVVRILFAVPASSAAIERDFGVSGMMVTSQRTSLSKYNIDMCSFLNRNRDFTDICDCKPLTDDEYDNALPANMLVSLEPADIALPFADEWEIQMMQNFSAASFDEESNGE
ncbi:hypothetical protein BBJ28_00015818 [Nothophytophthora sp. Chile5]|nr:hypothetical protein BBJ28_00015818 [Nothophytophthora sp. Chile5]